MVRSHAEKKKKNTSRNYAQRAVSQNNKNPLCIPKPTRQKTTQGKGHENYSGQHNIDKRSTKIAFLH